MSRKIKFRAWDKDKKIMVYQNENNSDEYWDGVCCSEIDMVNSILNENPSLNSYEWLQYTGLKDKNDKEIYEGDIVKAYESNIICEVIYTEGAMFMLRWNDTKWGNNEYHHYGLGAFTLEVIGNIYESPERLKEV